MKILICLITLTLPLKTQDLYFQYAVEESIIKEHHPHMPEKIIRMLEGLGASDWRERDRASVALYDYCLDNPRDRRWLFWGRRSVDPEIGIRCNRIIRQLNTCGNCGGKGWNGSSPNVFWACNICGGTGTAWYLTAWD